MLGIIGLCLLQFTCILLSMCCSLPVSYQSKERNCENGADFNLVFSLHWLSHWICKVFDNISERLANWNRFTKTNMSYGVNEVLLASVLGSVVFAVFAAQPLVIVGVTGPITVFN